jgi:FkbM family methyltransferase
LQLPNSDHALELLDGICSQTPASIPGVDQHEGEVVLYGAGNLGRLAFDFLRHVGVRVKYVLDRSAYSGMCLASEVKVYSPIEATPDPLDLVLVTTVSSPFTSIRNDLVSLGFRRVLPFYDYAQHYSSRHPLNNGWFTGPVSQDDHAGMAAVLRSLTEPQSRAAYLQFLAWRILRQDWIFDAAPVTPHDRYFISPVTASLSSEEHVLDVGAYDGRVLLRFLGITQNRLSSALLIEPDSQNLGLLDTTLNNLPSQTRAKIKVLPLAIAHYTGSAPFMQGFDLTSRVCETATTAIACSRLDDLDFPASFIKLHIEGGEYRALQGGVHLLGRNRPVLAATIYHTRDGLWKSIALLRECLDNYELLLRLHSWCGTGFVMYGLPIERLDHSAT